MTAVSGENALLEVDGLRVSFHTREGEVQAVQGISYSVAPGEAVGIVGESGSGKSVSQYALLGLLPMPPARIEGGAARFRGDDLLTLPRRKLRTLRGNQISMIFQDPMTALNPYMRVEPQLIEPLQAHHGVGRTAAKEKALEALHAVGIQDAARRLRMYPHEFSGGMRQRVTIAMALITSPALLIADEPTTALDVTVQAQILALIRRSQQELHMALTLITHDLGVVAATCDHVLVMYAGRVLEQAPVRRLFAQTAHPYTRALMGALPSTSAAQKRLVSIPGLPPDLRDPSRGCPFAPRCAHARPQCTEKPAELRKIAPSHRSACIRVQDGELAPGAIPLVEASAAS